MWPPSRTSIISSGLIAAAAGLPVMGAALGDASWAPFVIGGAVFLCGGTGNYILLERRSRFVRERQRFFLENACAPALDELRKHDPTARLNVMRVSGLLRRKFVFHYQHGFEPKADDGQLELGTNQGVAGLAYEHRSYAIGDFKANKVRTANGYVIPDCWRNMSSEQRKRCAALTLAISHPIFQLGKLAATGDVQPVGDVCGVVNLDSQLEDPATVYDPLLGQLLRQDDGLLPAIARVASYVLS